MPTTKVYFCFHLYSSFCIINIYLFKYFGCVKVVGPFSICSLVRASALISHDSCRSLLCWCFHSCLFAFHQTRTDLLNTVVFLRRRTATGLFLLVVRMTWALIYFNEPESQDNSTIIQFHSWAYKVKMVRFHDTERWRCLCPFSLSGGTVSMSVTGTEKGLKEHKCDKLFLVIRWVIIEVFYIPPVTCSSVHDRDRNEEKVGVWASQTVFKLCLCRQQM